MRNHQEDSTFGDRPNRPVLTCHVNQTIRDGIINGMVDIDKYDDLQKVLWSLAKTFLFRGCKEHANLTWTRFEFGIYDKPGPKEGFPYVQFLCGCDKTQSLSVANHTILTSDVRNIHVCDPDDFLDLYILMMKYKEMCDPTQDRFYCKKLSGLQLQKHAEKFRTIKYQSNKNLPIGYNTLSKWGQELAKKCGVEDWKKCTNHGFRSYAITENANNPHISLPEGMALSRHKTTQAYLTYTRCTDASEIARIQAIEEHNRKINKIAN